MYLLRSDIDNYGSKVRKQKLQPNSEPSSIACDYWNIHDFAAGPTFADLPIQSLLATCSFCEWGKNIACRWW